MLPTQFTPEYYRDAKDILWARNDDANRPADQRPRRSLFAFVRRLLGHLTHKPARKEEPPVSSTGQLSH